MYTVQRTLAHPLLVFFLKSFNRASLWNKGNETRLEHSDNAADSVTHASPLCHCLTCPIIWSPSFPTTRSSSEFQREKNCLQWSDLSDPIAFLTGFNVSRFSISQDESNQGEGGRRNNLGYFFPVTAAGQEIRGQKERGEGVKRQSSYVEEEGFHSGTQH